MKTKTEATLSSRRKFLKTSLGAPPQPAFLPSSRRASSDRPLPSNRINVGAIGVGRISRVHDLPGIWKYDQAASWRSAISTPTASNWARH